MEREEKPGRARCMACPRRIGFTKVQGTTTVSRRAGDGEGEETCERKSTEQAIAHILRCSLAGRKRERGRDRETEREAIGGVSRTDNGLTRDAAAKNDNKIKFSKIK